jgi:uncharacterized protein with GYD domain
MPTYVTLIRFTEQGASSFKDTQKRAAAFKEAAARGGVTVREQLWTLGAYDGLLVLDAPDEQTVTAAMLGLSSVGNVRTQTMRAFDESEIGEIVRRASGAGGGTGPTAGGASGSSTSSGTGNRKRGR